MSFLIVFSAFSLDSQFDYPYDFSFKDNPVIRNHGAADPDTHICDAAVLVYYSRDRDGEYSNMDSYRAFSSTDMIQWTNHGDIFNFPI